MINADWSKSSPYDHKTIEYEIVRTCNPELSTQNTAYTGYGVVVCHFSCDKTVVNIIQVKTNKVEPHFLELR